MEIGERDEIKNRLVTFDQANADQQLICEIGAELSAGNRAAFGRLEQIATEDRFWKLRNAIYPVLQKFSDECADIMRDA